MRRLNRVSASGRYNPAMEMEMTDGVVNQSEQQPVVGSAISRTSVSSAAKAAAQWASYTCSRWKRVCRQCVKRKPTGEFFETMYKGLALDEDVIDGGDKSFHLNKRLLDHFRDLASSNQDTDEVDLQYLSDVIADGADPNSTDRYGQTVLHEISRAWNVDVMRFFLDRGADVLRPDSYGVTPLHVAAALDYEEMIHFLLERKADIGAQTNMDHQTPLHYAAKNDAVGAVKVLLQYGADISARDYKRRTPLQLAANLGSYLYLPLDRSEAARTLMELGADAGVKDSDGQLCITAMIDKMTSVAHLALNQFHVTDRMTRQQFYYLHLLEPEPPCKQNPPGQGSQEGVASEPTSPLEFIVHQGKLDLIMHPVVLKLITVKWKLYGRLGAWILLLLNFLFIVSWTTVAISVSVIRTEEPYVFPEDWWRVFGVVVALGLTVVEVGREVAEMIGSSRKLRSWQSWCEHRTNDDLRCTHPMWPEEKHFLEEQIKLIHRMKGNYLQDPWNIFDWLVYILLMAVFGIHVADIFLLGGTLRDYSLRLFAVVIIFLWLRLMKHVRAFRVMGPFIVMLGKIVGDVLRFLFLYAEIFIPYACAFWIIFGGQASIPSMRTVPQLLYSLYRITLVDEYEFNAMVEVDSIMAHFLCGTFLALSSILCVNLMIALLSDTFQRVYDNALANAVMQQAAIILQVEESMPRLCRFYDDQHIHRFCAPLGELYDDDIRTDSKRHAELKTITTQIKETLDEFLEIQKEVNPPEQGRPDESDRASGERRFSFPVQGEHLQTLQRLQVDQTQQSQDLSALRADMKNLQALIHQLIQSQTSSCVGCGVTVKAAESTGSEPVEAPPYRASTG
ncbi:transient receptor potential cation channel subfamily V member 5 isoform X1 [Oncorhynchus mykiss]|uniref:transient receptor potential cation channel subfamily V member 5 isoform X1 n=1 Tax=Oncorhynchus mykiss TaxID=8022 RepID=UPI000B4FB31E|nr:transient receptor potential cation channel subfamily V member 5 isoform X1 [Oncorhynchus mykiss]